MVGIVVVPVFLLCALEFIGRFEPSGWKLAALLTPTWSLWLSDDRLGLAGLGHGAFYPPVQLRPVAKISFHHHGIVIAREDAPMPPVGSPTNAFHSLSAAGLFPEHPRAASRIHAYPRRPSRSALA